MTTGETEAFATRFPSEEAELVWKAIEQTGLSRSDFVARGLRYYLEENPDDIPALRSDDPDPDPLAKIGVLPARSEQEWTGIKDR